MNEDLWRYWVSEDFKIYAELPISYEKHQFTANIFQFYGIFLKQPYNQRDLLGRGLF